MSSRGRKKASVYEKLHQLRSVTNSTAVNKTSIIIDAFRYIKELKEKVDKLNQEIGTSSQVLSTSQNPLPMVSVEALEKGFVINVFIEKNCPGLIVSLLGTFEELLLDVLQARVSCEDNFKLQANLVTENQGNTDQGSIDAQMVKQAVIEAITKWGENNQQD